MRCIGDAWPLYRLRLRTGSIELRYPDEADLAALADLTREPVHDPATMPFTTPWTDAPEGQRIQGTLQWHWRCRAEWSPADWRLELVAVEGGEVVGTQGVHGREFAVTREVQTGSWVGRRHQGRGVGAAMRAAVLHLAFAGLAARTARSGAFEDNVASLRVSEKLGYARDGSETHPRRGQPGTVVRLLMSREAWESRPRPPVEIDGLEACIGMFGVEA